MSDAPEELDDGVPNVARIYDYLLGGSHNFAVDRERAAIVAARPGIVVSAAANRAFLRHAVEHALDLGVRQFLDLGSGIPTVGIPTVGSVHEIAHCRDPATRVAYVDHEPVAIAHSQTILAGVEGATIVDADLRDPAVVLAAPGVADALDLHRPVAVLLLAAVHFIPDDDVAVRVLSGYREALSPGSLVALSHTSDDYPDHPEFAEATRESVRLYEGTSHPVALRSRARISALLRAAGFRPTGEPRDLAHWATPAHGGPLGAYAVISEPLS